MIFRVKATLIDGLTIICYGSCMTYEGRHYVHIRKHPNAHFNWLPLFNDYAKRLSEERGVPFTPFTSINEVRLVYATADYDLYVEWKKRWLSENCLEALCFRYLDENEYQKMKENLNIEE